MNSAELDALEAEMGSEVLEPDSVPSYMQPDKESDADAELNLPTAPSGQHAVPQAAAQVSVGDMY